MSGARVSVSPGGFTAAPRIGFAAHMEKARSYGSYAPPVQGFAAAYRRGLEEIEQEQARLAEKAVQKSSRRKPKKASQPLEGDTYPAAPESSGRKTRRKPVVDVSRHIKLDLDIGRPLIYDSKGDDWDSYGQRLVDANPAYANRLAAIRPSRLILRYLTSEQAQQMFANRLGEERLRSSSAERKRARELCDQLNGCIAAGANRELDKVEGLFDKNPALGIEAIRQQRDPDNSAQQYSDQQGKDPFDAKPWQSLWLPAQFEVESDIANSTADRLSIGLSDSGGVLASGRDHFIDMLDDSGFDVSGIDARWTPQVDIVELTDGLTVDRLDGLKVPNFGQLMPLGMAYIHENRR